MRCKSAIIMNHWITKVGTKWQSPQDWIYHVRLHLIFFIRNRKWFTLYSWLKSRCSFGWFNLKHSWGFGHCPCYFSMNDQTGKNIFLFDHPCKYGNKYWYNMKMLFTWLNLLSFLNGCDVTSFEEKCPKHTCIHDDEVHVWVQSGHWLQYVYWKHTTH